MDAAGSTDACHEWQDPCGDPCTVLLCSFESAGQIASTALAVEVDTDWAKNSETPNILPLDLLSLRYPLSLKSLAR
eukprot:757606-Hanusia_phi.AAC.1